MQKQIAAFLSKYNFPLHMDIDSLTNSLLYDMNEGLSGRKSDEDMIKTYCNPPSEKAAGKSVIVIDAGGTNFRSCLVTFDADGNAQISEMEKTKMPGIEKELTKKEFFNQFADNLEHLKNKSENIGFCFSYPMTVTEDGDGILIGFAKEVKAPEVVGCRIGKELKAVLTERGWNNIKKITLLNDTLAALLAGAACPDEGKKYSSYIGFILGTGMNAAYIQPENQTYNMKTQVVVNENGKFSQLVCSDFDRMFDRKSSKPGTSLLEKQCSGAYLGPVSWEILHKAAEENLFSEKFNAEILKLESLTLIELDAFLHAPFSSKSVLGKLAADYASEDDYEKLYDLLDAVTERSARCASAILSACVIKSEAGKKSCEPVCILCNGTTFYKTHKIFDRVKGYLEEYLVNQRGLYFEIISRDNDITLGTAIAGLI